MLVLVYLQILVIQKKNRQYFQFKNTIWYSFQVRYFKSFQLKVILFKRIPKA